MQFCFPNSQSHFLWMSALFPVPLEDCLAGDNFQFLFFWIVFSFLNFGDRAHPVVCSVISAHYVRLVKFWRTVHAFYLIFGLLLRFLATQKESIRMWVIKTYLGKTDKNRGKFFKYNKGLINHFSQYTDPCGHFEPKISPIVADWGDFRTWKDRKVPLKPQFSILWGCPRIAGRHFLTVDYSYLEDPLSFASTFKPLGWTKRALPENEHKIFPEVPVSSILAAWK